MRSLPLVALSLFALPLSAAAQTSSAQTVRQTDVANAVERTQKAAPAPEPTLYIRAGHLFDSVSGKMRDHVTLVVAKDRIQALEPGDFKIPAGAKVIDLSADYVLPGLIDCHTHLGARADRYNEVDAFVDTPFDSAIAGVVNANKRSRPALRPFAT